MTLRLNGSTSGYTEIDAPAVAGSNTLVLPTGNGTADQALVTNGSGTLSFADRGRMVLETAKTATGTSIDFTGIPSWVKRMTVMLQGVSTNGTSEPTLRIGSGSVDVTGYAGSVTGVATGSTAVSNLSTGFAFIYGGGNNANIIYSGSIALTLLNSSTNLWVANGNLGRNDNTTFFNVAGAKTLSGTLDRIRITTVNGTDTFDAGAINILYEG